jgi:hypothetical protein
MRSAPEMKEITDKVIKEQSKSSNAILEKIDAYIYEEANNGEYFCYISDRHELFEYMCEGLIRQRLNIAGYTITPLYDLKGELYSYKIEWK